MIDKNSKKSIERSTYRVLIKIAESDKLLDSAWHLIQNGKDTSSEKQRKAFYKEAKKFWKSAMTNTAEQKPSRHLTITRHPPNGS